jgi:hypothetical protein
MATYICPQKNTKTIHFLMEVKDTLLINTASLLIWPMFCQWCQVTVILIILIGPLQYMHLGSLVCGLLITIIYLMDSLYLRWGLALYFCLLYVNLSGFQMAFCLCLGFSIKKINSPIFKFSSPPPPLKLFLREAYKVSANELMIHVLICI